MIKWQWIALTPTHLENLKMPKVNLTNPTKQPLGISLAAGQGGFGFNEIIVDPGKSVSADLTDDQIASVRKCSDLIIETADDAKKAKAEADAKAKAEAAEADAKAKAEAAEAKK